MIGGDLNVVGGLGPREGGSRVVDEEAGKTKGLKGLSCKCTM